MIASDTNPNTGQTIDPPAEHPAPREAPAPASTLAPDAPVVILNQYYVPDVASTGHLLHELARELVLRRWPACAAGIDVVGDRG